MAVLSDGSAADATSNLIIAPTDPLEDVNVEGEVSYRGAELESPVSTDELTNIANQEGKITKPEATNEDKAEATETLQAEVHPSIVSGDDIYRLKDEIDWDQAAKTYKQAEKRGVKTAMGDMFLKAGAKGIKGGDVPFVNNVCKVVGSSALNSAYPNPVSKLLRKQRLGSGMNTKQTIRFVDNELIPSLEEISPGWSDTDLEKADGSKEKVSNLTPHTTSSKSTRRAFKSSKSKKHKRDSAVGSQFNLDTIEDLQKTYRKFN